MRTLFAAILLAALSLASLSGLESALAQRGGQNANASSQKPKKPGSTKRVIVGRGNDTGAGSRQTIQSDDNLHDYSAYRSGDRFNVVIPNADAGAIPKGGGGRGYTDMQVQQRGKDVVLSYRLQPGAKPRVEQKFNRLDVVFETPGAAAPSSANKQPQVTASPAANDNRAANTRQTQAANRTGQPGQPTTNESAPTRTPPASAQTTAQPAPTQQQQVTSAPPAGGLQLGPLTSATPAATVTPQAPAASPSAVQQIAQARQPERAAPATAPNVPATTAQPGASLGAALLRNWPVALSIALLLVGLGLFFAARRTSATSRPPAALEDVKETGKAELKETPAAVALKDSTAAASLSTPAAEPAVEPAAVKVWPVVAAPALAEALEEEAPAAEAEAGVTDEAGVTVEEKEVEPAIEDAAAWFSVVSDVEPTAVEEVEAPPAEEVEAVEPPAIAEPPAEEIEEVSPPSTEIEAVSQPSEVEAETTIEAAPVIVAAAPATEIEPTVAADAESVQAETKRLLDGERYDKGVVKAADMVARRLVAAELLSALSGRNAERRARARAAFVDHGFFNEAAHDLHYAEAPAERAGAARSLALAGDRAATSHLVAALEDKAVEVRRAAVEGLADLRDPKAVGPLEALRERQKKFRDRLPRRLLQNAIEVCRAGVEETAPVVAPVAEAATVETVTVEAPAPEVAPEIEAAQAIEPGVVELEAPAPAAEVAPVEEAFEERAPFVEEFAPVVAEEVAAAPEVVEEAPAEQTVEAPAEVLVEAPVEAPLEESVEEQVEEPVAAVEVSPVSAVESAEDSAVMVEESPAAVAERSFVEELPSVEESRVEDSFIAGLPVAEPEPAIEDSRAVEAVETEAFVPVESAPAFEQEAGTAVESKEVEPVSDEAAAWFSMVSNVEPAAAEAPHVEETAVAPHFEEPAAAEAPAVEIEAHRFEAETPAVVEESVAPPVEAEPSKVETPVFHDDAEIMFGDVASDWEELDVKEASFTSTTPAEKLAPTTVNWFDEGAISEPLKVEPEAPAAELPATEIVAGGAVVEEKGIEQFDEYSTVPKAIQQRIVSHDASERVAAVADLSRLDSDEAFHQICAAFDDESREVRSAAARALYELRPDRADSFTRALREASAERRRQIGAAIQTSGLGAEAIGQLTGESREKTYEAFSLLFLMAKAGEVQPLLRAIEGHPNTEVRLAVVKLLALSGQKEILPAFRRLAIRGSLPTEVRSAVMEAIYQISSSQDAPSAA